MPSFEPILAFLCPLIRYTRTSGVVCFSRANHQRNVGQCASWALPQAKPPFHNTYKRYLFICLYNWDRQNDTHNRCLGTPIIRPAASRISLSRHKLGLKLSHSKYRYTYYGKTYSGGTRAA